MKAAGAIALDALGNPVRRDILGLLATRSRSVGELAASLPVSRPAVSRHLRLLANAGLVRREDLGTKNIYHLEASGFEEAQAYLRGFWGGALKRFKLAAENRTPKKGCAK